MPMMKRKYVFKYLNASELLENIEEMPRYNWGDYIEIRGTITHI